jgi:hypothetical protein
VGLSLFIAATGASAQTASALYDYAVPSGNFNGFTLAKGKLLGITPTPGTGLPGTFYQLTAPWNLGEPWTETTLYTFRSGFPISTLTAGENGAYYGILAYGGASGVGGVYELSPPTQSGSPWNYKLLYSFNTTECYNADCSITGPPTLDAAGNVYVAVQGATTSGAVIELSPPSAGSSTWTKSTLYTFQDDEGGIPNGGMQIGAGGVIYGTNQAGGIGSCGTVFALYPPTSSGGAWTEATLHEFNPGVSGPPYTDGCVPIGGLAQDSSGGLYGTTTEGGTNGSYGIVFQVVPSTSAYAVIHSFSGTDGRGPEAPPVVGSGGVLYGTAGAGGYKSTGGLGTVHELTPPSQAGGAWLNHNSRAALRDTARQPGFAPQSNRSAALRVIPISSRSASVFPYR